MTASPRETESPDGSRTPVFVDDSGRRLVRARLFGRVCVGLVGAYGVLVAVGLAGSATLPTLHLADLGRLPPRSESTPRLATGSKVIVLPRALQPEATANGGPNEASNPPAGAVGGGSPSRAPSIGGGGNGSPVAGQEPVGVTPGSTSRPTTSTTRLSTTTTSPTTSTTPTTAPTTTTTRAHGPPTSVRRGPPSGHGPKSP